MVDTSGFHMRYSHENPTSIPIESRTQLADHVSIGHYELGAAVKTKIDNWVDFTSDARPDDPAVKLHSGFYYHCNDVWNPEVGDVRIMFSFAGLEGSKVSSTICKRLGSLNLCNALQSIRSSPSSANCVTAKSSRTLVASVFLCCSSMLANTHPVQR